MCDKIVCACRCPKAYTWLTYNKDGWHYVSPEGEYLVFVSKRSETLFAFGDRKFVSEEAAKAAVEKSFAPVKDHTSSILSDIRDTVMRYKEVGGGAYAAQAAINQIKRQLTDPRK